MSEPTLDLLEKFAAVDIRPTDCLTEADRQFCQRQQEIYQDAVESFYQIAALWAGLCSRQEAALSEPKGWDDKWKKKYLVSRWWPELKTGAVLKHISGLHREFISTLVTYLNTTYHLTLNTGSVTDALLTNEPCYSVYDDAVDQVALTPVVLHYQDAVKLILSGFDGRTFKEQAPHELVEGCHQAAWREKDHQANFEQKKNLVKIISGACDYGYYSGHEQWHIQTDGKAVLKGLAHFETGAFDRYPDGIGDLLSENRYLWYDLWEFEECEKLEKIRLFKNGRMDIRFTNEGWAREFVSTYLGTVW